MASDADHFRRIGNELLVDLWYPPRDGAADKSDNPRYIRAGLVDVRAADDIRISYDFDRDGWRIEQCFVNTHFAEDGAVESGDDWEEWREVAFVHAWALETQCGQCENGGNVMTGRAEDGRLHHLCQECSYEWYAAAPAASRRGR